MELLLDCAKISGETAVTKQKVNTPKQKQASHRAEFMALNTARMEAGSQARVFLL